MDINQLFTEATLIKQLNVEDAVAVAKYPASTAFIDVSDLKSFVFLIGAGALTSELTFQVEQDTSATQTASVKNVTDADVVIPANGDDKWYTIEVKTDQLDKDGAFHYVTLKATGAAGADDFACIYFFGLNPGKMPVTQGADCGEVVTLAG
jgi:hypothetical protein